MEVLKHLVRRWDDDFIQRVNTQRESTSKYGITIVSKCRIVLQSAKANTVTILMGRRVFTG